MSDHLSINQNITAMKTFLLSLFISVALMPVAAQNPEMSIVTSLHSDHAENSGHEIIRTGRSCPFPIPNITGCSYTNLQTVDLSWNMTQFAVLQWDSGENSTSFGTSATFSVAMRWPAENLQPYIEWYLTHILFFPTSADANFEMRVWKNFILIMTQTVDSFVVDEWNEVELNTPVPIEADHEYLIGFHFHSISNEPAIGCDAGPAVAGYGDLINLAGEWEMLSSFGLDFNWNIAAIVASDIDTPAKRSEINSFTVYRDDLQVATLPPTVFEYTDNLPTPEAHAYVVGAMYDTCSSYSQTCQPSPVSWVEVTPDELYIQLISGEVLTDQFVISNVGHAGSAAAYDLTVYYPITKQSKAAISQQWLALSTDSGIVAGQHADTIYIEVDSEGLDYGDYFAIIDVATDAFNQQSFSVLVYVDILVGIEEAPNEAIHIYPNPTGGYLHIEGGGRQTRITIYNTSGLEVLDEQIQMPAIIDLSEQQAGVYFIRIENSGRHFHKKVVKY